MDWTWLIGRKTGLGIIEEIQGNHAVVKKKDKIQAIQINELIKDMFDDFEATLNEISSCVEDHGRYVP